MKTLKSSFINMALVLAGITAFAGVTLASVYTLTKDSITGSQVSKRGAAIRAVLPPYDHVSLKPIELKNGVETTNVFKAYDKNNLMVGAAVESTSNNGFRGAIDIIVGFNVKGVIVNYEVLDQHETLGLGAKMETWFKTSEDHQDIRGKNAGTANLNVSKDGGEVDAITGATISSRAFLFAVRNAYFAFTSNPDVWGNGRKSKVDSISDSAHKGHDTNSQNVMKGSHP